MLTFACKALSFARPVYGSPESPGAGLRAAPRSQLALSYPKVARLKTGVQNQSWAFSPRLIRNPNCASSRFASGTEHPRSSASLRKPRLSGCPGGRSSCGIEPVATRGIVFFIVLPRARPPSVEAPVSSGTEAFCTRALTVAIVAAFHLRQPRFSLSILFACFKGKIPDGLRFVSEVFCQSNGGLLIVLPLSQIWPPQPTQRAPTTETGARL